MTSQSMTLSRFYINSSFVKKNLELYKVGYLYILLSSLLTITLPIIYHVLLSSFELTQLIYMIFMRKLKSIAPNG